MMKTLNSKDDEIIISTYKADELYFSVGFSSLNNKIVRIALPSPDFNQSVTEISNLYEKSKVSDEYNEIAKIISKLYYGENLVFDLEYLDLNIRDSKDGIAIKTPFRREVLIQTSQIPFGEVRTYKYIAEKLGTHAYRAVGTALRNNPFPIVIPCHRVVKSNMQIGKYRGGSDMKKEILKHEKIKINGYKIFQ